MFSQFWGKKNFSWDRLYHAQLHIWVSSTMSNFRKNLWYNYKKMPGQMAWWKDGRTDRPYFIGPFPLPPRVQKLTDMKTYIWHKNKEKKIKRPALPLVNAGPPARVSVLSTKCEECHPNGLTVASSRKIKQIIITLKFIYAKANSLFC